MSMMLVTAMIMTTAIALRSMGRVWGEPSFWIGEIDSKHTSQRVADPYTFSHVLHGVLFYWAMSATSWTLPTKIVAATALECAWELTENTERVINRYRTETASLGYDGDSVLNSVSDIVSMLVGLYFAHALPWYASACLVVVVELVLLALYRDNLTLNIIMLLRPNAKIKAWQTKK